MATHNTNTRVKKRQDDIDPITDQTSIKCHFFSILHWYSYNTLMYFRPSAPRPHAKMDVNTSNKLALFHFRIV